MEKQKLTISDLTEFEKKLLAALRDPVKGPKIREVMLRSEQGGQDND